MRTLPRVIAIAVAIGDSTAHAEPNPSVVGEQRLTFELAKLVTSDGNACMSPASIHVALGMVFAGARGTTADEMARTLHYEPGVHDQIGSVLHSLAGAAHDHHSLSIVDRLYGQRGMSWDPSFLALVDKHYGAPLEAIDFKASEDARKQIDRWVAGVTHDKIPELLPRNALKPVTRLVVVNAVYFKSPWTHPFDKARTAELPFAARGATPVKVPTMRQVDEFRAGGNADVQIVELPYRDTDLAMDIVLPRAKTNLAAVEAKLDGAAFATVVTTLKMQTVDLTLPKFRVRTAVDLHDMLEKLGMHKAFSRDAADFSAMTTRHERLWIDAVYHEGFVDVDEAGTEAAAATAVVMTDDAAPAPRTAIHVDRPFVWVIRDLTTGEILFWGRIVDPRT